MFRICGKSIYPFIYKAKIDKRYKMARIVK